MTRRDARGRNSWRTTFGALLAVLTLGAAAALTGCASSGDAVPRCTDPLRLAIVAQSVPSASYLPCIRDLPPNDHLQLAPPRTAPRFLLISDRSPAEPVVVRLATACRFRFSGASPSPARAPGVLSYIRLDSIRPRFAGRLYDVFPGGCVTYSFDFGSGSQIELMEQFERAVGLYPRQQLRLVLKQELGVELNP